MDFQSGQERPYLLGRSHSFIYGRFCGNVYTAGADRDRRDPGWCSRGQFVLRNVAIDKGRVMLPKPTDIERRYHPSKDPPEWFREFMGGWDTDAGVNVTPDSAMQVTAWLACIRIISEVVASLPFVTYRRLTRGKDRAFDHYLYPILHDIANPEMTAFTYRRLITSHVLSRGNGLSEIEFNRGGQIRALWPLDPDKTELMRDPKTKKLFYLVTLPVSVGGQKVRLPYDRVFHIRWASKNGLWGLSPTQLARQALGLAIATEKHGNTLFANGAEPGIILTTPQELSDKAYERLQRDWEDMHQGLDKAHRVAILEGGSDVDKLTITNEDAQFLQTRKFQIAEIGRIFGVSLDMLDETDKAATYASVEQFSIRFTTLTLRSWLVNWEQEVFKTLFAESERREYFAEHVIDGLLRGDSQSRYQVYTAGFNTGAFSINDIREMENRNPVEGGDQHFVPLNMIPVDQAGALEGQNANPNGNRSLIDEQLPENRVRRPQLEERATRSARIRRRIMLSQRKVFRDVANRVLKRERQDILTAAKKAFRSTTEQGETRDLPAFSLWLNEYYRNHKAVVRKGFAPVMESYGEQVAAAAGDEVAFEDFEEESQRFVTSYIDGYVDRHVRIHEKRIRDRVTTIMQSGSEDPLGELETWLEDWQDGRSGEIAQWESSREGSAVAKLVYGLAGFASIRWVTVGDTCPYCKSLDGMTVGMEELFLNSNVEYQPDGADAPLNPSFDVGHPPAHGGCDCLIVAA